MLCNTAVVEDEMHFMLSCERDDLFASIQESIPNINYMNNDDKFVYMMSGNDYDTSKSIIDYVNIAMGKRKVTICPDSRSTHNI